MQKLIHLFKIVAIPILFGRGEEGVGGAALSFQNKHMAEIIV